MRSLRAIALSATALIAAPAVFAASAPVPSAPLTASAIDASVRPADDFYRYANGPWLTATQRPAGAASFDTSVAMIERTYSKFIADHGDAMMRRAVFDADAPAAGNVVPLVR